MTVSRRSVLAAGAAAVPATAIAALAQQPGTGAAGQAGQQLGEDPFLAACLLIGGKKQIEVCQFALEKCQDQDVKQFAQAEIAEHQTVKAELAKFGYTPPAPVAAGGVQPAGGAVPQGGRMAAVSVGRVTLSPGVSQVAMIDQEVHETCIANTKAMLTKKEQEKGKTKFDKAFVGEQLHAHTGLLDKVTVFQRHATQEMQPVLKTAEQTIRQHIATCEKLMEKLEQQAMREMQGGGTGSRPGGNGDR